MPWPMSIPPICAPPETSSGEELILPEKGWTHRTYPNTNHQYNFPDMGRISRKCDRNKAGVSEHFTDPSVQKSIDLDVALIEHYDKLLNSLEQELSNIAKVHDADSYFRLRSIHGIGRILGLTILYEIHDINRFPSVQDFVSYCRLVKSAKESAGKIVGSSGKKIAMPIWNGPSPRLPYCSWGETRRRLSIGKTGAQARQGQVSTILAHKLARLSIISSRKGGVSAQSVLCEIRLGPMSLLRLTGAIRVNL